MSFSLPLCLLLELILTVLVGEADQLSQNQGSISTVTGADNFTQVENSTTPLRTTRKPASETHKNLVTWAVLTAFVVVVLIITCAGSWLKRKRKKRRRAEIERAEMERTNAVADDTPMKSAGSDNKDVFIDMMDLVMAKEQDKNVKGGVKGGARDTPHTKGKRQDKLCHKRRGSDDSKTSGRSLASHTSTKSINSTKSVNSTKKKRLKKKRGSGANSVLASIDQISDCTDDTGHGTEAIEKHSRSKSEFKRWGI